MAFDILVLGVGNILLSDEGVGVWIVEQLRARHVFSDRVTVIDGGTMGLELLPYLEGKSHLFLVDAVCAEGPPGTFTVKELPDPPAYFRQKISPHQIGLSEVMAVAAMQECLPAKVKLFGIVPKDLSTGLSLSVPVAAAAEQAISSLVAELDAMGLSVSLRA
ncbi:HyaD/HybD family hydrogenase maturation endopeptidase [Thiovibrio sp. JS02]